MVPGDALGVLTARLQDAALDSALWPSALSSLSEFADGAGAVLFSTSQRLAVQFSPDQGETLETYHRDGWNVRDERYRGVPTMQRKGITTEADFIDAEAIKRSPFYRDFLERYGLRWFAGLGFSLDGDFYCVSVQRRIDQGPFETAEIERLRRMLVPIHETITITQKLGAVRMTSMLDALELMAQPALVCNKRGRIVAINTIAERLFSESIDTRSRQFRLTDSQSQSNLDALLKSAIAREGRSPHETTTTIRDRKGFWRLVRAVALEKWVAPFLDDACVLLLLPPGALRAQNLASVQKTFGLTATEAALALELATGHSLETAAGRLGNTYQTARGCLKTIFRKTGVHRQAELVALLAGLDP